MLSVHTSPLAQPGTGDAGGMNVYVLQSALQMARRGVEVEIFTRATSSADQPVVKVAPAGQLQRALQHVDVHAACIAGARLGQR